MVDPRDTEGLKVPIAVFASKDEPKEDISKSHEVVKKKPFADKSVRLSIFFPRAFPLADNVMSADLQDLR
jgi:hypothetical protein